MPNDPLQQRIGEKLNQGRPVAFAAEEADHFREALREALGVTLDTSPANIADTADIFDELGVDSIDVFDMVDQLITRYKAPIALEELPPELLRGDAGLTFAGFAQGILDYFATPPAEASEEEGSGGA
jgi:acyl carrier protein